MRRPAIETGKLNAYTKDTGSAPIEMRRNRANRVGFMGVIRVGMKRNGLRHDRGRSLSVLE